MKRLLLSAAVVSFAAGCGRPAATTHQLHAPVPALPQIPIPPPPTYEEVPGPYTIGTAVYVRGVGPSVTWYVESCDEKLYYLYRADRHPTDTGVTIVRDCFPTALVYAEKRVTK